MPKDFVDLDLEQFGRTPLARAERLIEQGRAANAADPYAIADTRRELDEASRFVVPAIPAGTDATNDYWRARRAELTERLQQLTNDAERAALTAEPELDRCEACGMIDLCDCRVYLTP